nr:clostripain-related cysteine peptidase [Armatimonadota bacterium]
VLVYMNGANNLEPFSLLNMDQMESVPASTNVNIVVEWKRLHGNVNNGTINASDDALFDANAPEYDGTRRFWLTGKGKGNFDQDYIQDQGSGSVGSNPTTADQGSYRHLQSFLQWGQSNFPAQHYLVVLWNHGAGWKPIGNNLCGGTRSRGISYDDQSCDSIETWQIASAFAGLAPVDVVAMDASLMQMIEVNYDMRNITRYIVGSEDSPPGQGYPYDQWLSALTSQPATDPLTIARTICDTFANYYQNNKDVNGVLEPVTQSVVDTTKLTGVAQSMTTLANVLLQDQSQFASQFAASRDACTEFGNVLQEDPNGYPADYRDLVQYATLLKQNAPSAPGLTAAANGVISAVNASVLDNRGVRQDSFAQGLSVFVPRPVDSGSFDRGYDPTYSNLALARDTTWSQWLQAQTQ